MSQTETIWNKPSNVVSNDFNPNVMSKENFELLKGEMKAHPKVIFEVRPIIVAQKEVFYEGQPAKLDALSADVEYIIIDGEHRWRSATELKLPEVGFKVMEISEADAKGLCYRINKQRGTIHPLKEMELWLGEAQTMTHKEIGEKYGIDRSQVTKTVNIKKLPELVQRTMVDPWKTYKELGKIVNDHNPLKTEETIRPLTRSHLEALQGLPEARVYSLAFRAMDSGQSVGQVTQDATQIKRIIEEEIAEVMLVDSALMKNCPVCGEAGRPNLSAGRLECPKYCLLNDEYVTWGVNDEETIWLSTPVAQSVEELSQVSDIYEGKEATEENRTRSMHLVDEASAKREKKEAQAALWYKSPLTAPMITEGLGNFLLELLPELTSITSLRLEGATDGEDIILELKGNRTTRVFSFEKKLLDKPDIDPWEFEDSWDNPDAKLLRNWPAAKVNFTYQPGHWKRGTAQTRVELGYSHQDDAKELLPKVREFIDATADGSLVSRLSTGESKTSLVPTAVHGSTIEKAEDFIKRWEAGEVDPKSKKKSVSDAPRDLNPILDGFMGGEHSLVKVEVPDIEPAYLNDQLSDLIQTRDLGAEISVSLVDDVVYLAKS